jgi:hypothetical protein
MIYDHREHWVPGTQWGMMSLLALLAAVGCRTCSTRPVGFCKLAIMHQEEGQLKGIL